MAASGPDGGAGQRVRAIRLPEDYGHAAREGVDDASPFVVQEYQLLHAVGAAIYQIGAVIEAKW